MFISSFIVIVSFVSKCVILNIANLSLYFLCMVLLSSLIVSTRNKTDRMNKSINRSENENGASCINNFKAANTDRNIPTVAQSACNKRPKNISMFIALFYFYWYIINLARLMLHVASTTKLPSLAEINQVNVVHDGLNVLHKIVAISKIWV